MTRDRTLVKQEGESSAIAPYDDEVALSTAPSAKTRRLIILAMVGVAAALFAIAVIVYLDNPRTTDLPVAIQSVSPPAGSNVLSQTDVTVDLAVGYTAELLVNGIQIPETQLFRVQGLNQVSFQPRDGQVVERLLPDRNCISVEYWLIERGPEDAQTYTWCFDAS